MCQQGLDWQQRTELRQKEAVPVLEELGSWLKQQVMLIRPSCLLGKAIAYAHSRWAGLSAYALHGQILIDNNLVENAIRPLALGRKNGVSEFEWLKDVLERLPSHKQKTSTSFCPTTGKIPKLAFSYSRALILAQSDGFIGRIHRSAGRNTPGCAAAWALWIDRKCSS